MRPRNLLILGVLLIISLSGCINGGEEVPVPDYSINKTSALQDVSQHPAVSAFLEDNPNAENSAQVLRYDAASNDAFTQYSTTNCTDPVEPAYAQVTFDGAEKKLIAWYNPNTTQTVCVTTVDQVECGYASLSLTQASYDSFYGQLSVEVENTGFTDFSEALQVDVHFKNRIETYHMSGMKAGKTETACNLDVGRNNYFAIQSIAVSSTQCPSATDSIDYFVEQEICPNPYE